MANTIYPYRNFGEYPIQTTDTRPSTSGLAAGYIGFNSTSGKPEIWTGSAWKNLDGTAAAIKMPWADSAITFSAGNISAGSIAVIAKGMANSTPSTSAPTAGGTMTINSVSLGSYDYTIKSGSQTVTSFTNSDWFTSTEDTRSAWIVIKGDMTINSGVTFQPSNRKLFTVLYVAGDLTVSGTLSMTGKGANHNGTGVSGGATTKGAIRIVDGTFSSVTNPQVPSDGGAGGTTSYSASQPGSAGTAGGTGGGGSGTNDNTTFGYGAAGTSFSGGSGGGGGRTYSGLTNIGGTAATANGGAGGNALGAGGPYPTANPSSGGGGNNGGTGGENAGPNGTGGVLIVIIEGTLRGSGAIEAKGVAGASASERPGGATGGGSLTILAPADSSSFTPSAAGGAGYGIYGSQPSGGAGTARKLVVV